jgi:DNA repair protein RecN (Recombination protein N)
MIGPVTLGSIRMLSELVVEGLGVIDRAEITLDRGASALTGETGAGKTLVVAALSLLLGDRADRSLVREGAPEARVEGRFVVARSHPAVSLLRAHGILRTEEPDEEVELILTRSVAADGRSRPARINGRLVTVAVLEELGRQLVEIAGQQSQAGLASAAVQRALLDSFAGEDTVTLASEVADVVGRAARAERNAAELRSSARERRRELDLLRFEISEIEDAHIEAGESVRLRSDAQRLENAEVLAAGIRRVVDAVRGDGGAGELIEGAVAELSRLITADPALEGLRGRLEAAGYELADIGDELVRRIPEPDVGSLEEIRERLSVLSRLTRKYGDDEGGVLAYLDAARARASGIDSLDIDLERSEREAERWRLHAAELAARLGKARRKAAPRLERAVGHLLDELALPGARFKVVLRERDLYEGGTETVEYLISTNAGEAPRPLSKVASGGELSRISLAMHLLTASRTAETMIFDEVDAGVGGAAAQAVGRALADLTARTSSQVVVVTHLPQVAAFADRHYRVTKSPGDGRMTAVVEEIEGESRVAELSRMLAGLPESKRARDHAKELLDLASGRV